MTEDEQRLAIAYSERDEARAKIAALEAENTDLHTRFSRLLCHATGGGLSKTNYLSETMETAVTDYINKEREEAFAEGRQEVLEETGAALANKDEPA